MKMVHVLVVALGAAAVVGAKTFVDAPPPAETPIAAERPAPAAPTPAAAAPESGTIEGEVLEAIDVPGYSYYRLGAKGAPGTWVAVPSATLKVGDRASVRDAMRMNDFKSTALKRTFPVIYFGMLDGGSAPEAKPAPFDPHASAARAGATAADPHGRSPSGPVDVKPVEKASGPNGKTVAEVIGQRTSLAGKAVRVRATVVKSTPGILGRTYLHLRDGSGDASAGTDDLVATTESTPKVGDVIVLEGVVAIDRDIGAGYFFPTIVENAKILSN